MPSAAKISSSSNAARKRAEAAEVEARRPVPAKRRPELLADRIHGFLRRSRFVDRAIYDSAQGRTLHDISRQFWAMNTKDLRDALSTLVSEGRAVRSDERWPVRDRAGRTVYLHRYRAL